MTSLPLNLVFRRWRDRHPGLTKARTKAARRMFLRRLARMGATLAALALCFHLVAGFRGQDFLTKTVGSFVVGILAFAIANRIDYHLPQQSR